MQKPSYRTSKQAIWLNVSLAWAIILLLAIGSVFQGQTVAFASVAVPTLGAVILIQFGVHRHYGSRDMETMAAMDTAAPIPGMADMGGNP